MVGPRSSQHRALGYALRKLFEETCMFFVQCSWFLNVFHAPLCHEYKTFHLLHETLPNVLSVRRGGQKRRTRYRLHLIRILELRVLYSLVYEIAGVRDCVELCEAKLV